MDRTAEGAPTQPHAPQPAPTPRPVHVTPENVQELAKLFHDAAGRLFAELGRLERALRLPEAWMGDGTSKWMHGVFNKYFVDGENSFLDILRDIYTQHQEHATALQKAAEEYGNSEGRNAARPNSILGQLPG